MSRTGEARYPQSDRTGIPPADLPPTDRDTYHLFTVKDAGEMLGISPEAVRARLKRGTLWRETGEDGTVYVRLDADLSGNGHDGAADGMADRSDRAKGWTADGAGGDERQDSRDRLDDLREEVVFLREELRREREARVEEKRRHDTIVLQLAQRIPELETASSSPDTSEASTEPETGTETSVSDTEQPRPSWWRRFFGFE